MGRWRKIKCVEIKIPNSKFQIPNKFKIQISNFQFQVSEKDHLRHIPGFSFFPALRPGKREELATQRAFTNASGFMDTA
jgi:hypothetical protein